MAFLKKDKDQTTNKKEALYFTLSDYRKDIKDILPEGINDPELFKFAQLENIDFEKDILIVSHHSIAYRVGQRIYSNTTYPATFRKVAEDEKRLFVNYLPW